MNIIFTQKAQETALKVAKEEDISEPFRLRVKVLGGGCAGFQYDMHFEDKEPSMIDETKELENGLTLVCDPLSLQYLDGVEIDYSIEGLIGGFKFNNPNVSSQCGCGSSFAV